MQLTFWQLITLPLVYAFPCVFSVLACPHVHIVSFMLFGCFVFFFPFFGAPCVAIPLWWALRPLCVCVCAYTRVRLCPVCVRVYVIPGEPVAGQCVSPHQGHAGGGDADDRQPLRFGFPPLLLPSAPLQRLQGPPARGTHTTTLTPTHSRTPPSLPSPSEHEKPWTRETGSRP